MQSPRGGKRPGAALGSRIQPLLATRCCRRARGCCHSGRGTRDTFQAVGGDVSDGQMETCCICTVTKPPSAVISACIQFLFSIQYIYIFKFIFEIIGVFCLMVVFLCCFLLLIIFLNKLWFKLLRRNYAALEHLYGEISSVHPTGRGRERHNHIIRSTQETEEAEKQDRHLHVTGHAMKPSQPNTTMVEIAASSNCDEYIWNVLEVLSS